MSYAANSITQKRQGGKKKDKKTRLKKVDRNTFM